MTDEPLLKLVIWVGSSRKDLRTFPEPVQDPMGYALYVAQRGGKHPDTKTLSGFGGAAVVEVVIDYRVDTFRAVYTVRLGDAVYVLHAFLKKAKSGRATPCRDMELIRQRLREAEHIAKEREGMSKKKYEVGGRNVFKNLDLPNAAEHMVKAQLVYKIDTILKDRKLKQVEAGKLFGIPQPDVSKMLRGEFRQFSVERLLRFLVALNHDVEIVVRPHRGQGDPATLHVS